MSRFRQLAYEIRKRRAVRSRQAFEIEVDAIGAESGYPVDKLADKRLAGCSIRKKCRRPLRVEIVVHERPQL
ncbi:hypothetical protein D3C84_1110680 [compost metagenome]